jgi:hypothetical protein
MLPLFPFRGHALRVSLAHVRTTRVNLERVACLGIHQPRDSYVRQIALARILDRNRDDVVSLRQDLQRM